MNFLMEQFHFLDEKMKSSFIISMIRDSIISWRETESFFTSD